MAAAAKTLVLVTGATSGIGFELAAQLMARGASYHVLVGARSPEKGAAVVKDLQSRSLPGSAELLEIDVTKDDTIERAVASVERAYGRLDLLVNNAAVSAMQPPLRQQMREAFDTNATGPAVLTAAFAPLLHKSTASPARIVNVSSGAGSIARRLDPSSPIYSVQAVQYRASKAALHMVTACQVYEFESAGIKVFAYDPGFTQSNLGPHNKPEFGAKPASEAVMPLIDVLEGKRDDEAGKLLHNTGVYPW
ncbi:Cytochrome P450 [Macrophomina phaseolina MS6]|uniref:Cytochrome P450 n=2 Tax=Macrophomina phaseolina TaxID=35725 RepID=K2S3N1_MACPH|nr:Cytochrome P450 [Macrophomina phaseolina MS6]KAH7014683.1 putative short chain dehydrogenase/reductase [Macrophomina phaseolina]